MITEEDLAKIDEIIFVLEGRDKPTFVCLSVESYNKAEELGMAIEQRLPAYRFETLNLRGQQVESLFQAIREQVPARVLESKPVEYMLHVYGLEDSLFISRGDKPTLSTLIQELNFERENLFRTFPFCILLWTTPYFIDSLKKHAPDLWDWITYSYTFDDTECSETARVETGHWKQLPTGRLAEREERIKELEEKFRSLSLGKGSTQRILREKITIQKLLGREYAAAFHFSEAIFAYQAVLALLGQLPKRFVDEEAEVHFLLGDTQLNARRFNRAHKHFQISLELQQKVGDTRNVGSTYHQIGMVYEEQRRWSEALESYKEALSWEERTGSIWQIGSTHHQIGMSNEKQKRWSEALDSYHKALSWYEKTGQQHYKGVTYHQIGMVYQAQQRWSEALETYDTALNWKEKTRQHHEIGDTFHQIGMIYEEQRRWCDALESYEKALAWYEKTGLEHELGGTFHQIGRVYERQRLWSEALESYEKALDWHKRSGHDHEIGCTFHQIGIVYDEQRLWKEALENYEKALDWFEKTGLEYQLGATFHQIGRVYEGQRRWRDALKFYFKAIVSIVQYDVANRNMVEASITRIRGKVRRQIRERLLEQFAGHLPDQLKCEISRLAIV